MAIKRTVTKKIGKKTRTVTESNPLNGSGMMPLANQENQAVVSEAMKRGLPPTNFPLETGNGEIDPSECTFGRYAGLNLHFHRVLNDALQDWDNRANKLVSEKTWSPPQYVLVYAAGNYHQELQRHVLVVKKPEGTLHAGLYNLPGGKVNKGNESPSEAALRELKEETGYVGTFPQLVGAILPSIYDQELFLVWIYRAIINLNQTGTVESRTKQEQPASWQNVTDVLNGKFAPGLEVILPLCCSCVPGFIIRQSQNQPSCHSVSEVLFYREISVSARTKKQRFTT